MYLVNFEVLLMYLVNFEFLVTSTGTKYIIRKAYGYFLSRFNFPCLGPVFFLPANFYTLFQPYNNCVRFIESHHKK